ncbi:MAG: transcriptional regulator [Syntrophomonadaceae bacterium]|jgi:DNA-binding IscR family transcriptional regulator
MEEKEIVMDAFKKAGVPMSSKEIAEATGLDKKIVDKVIKQLKTEGTIHSPKRCYYEPAQ